MNLLKHLFKKKKERPLISETFNLGETKLIGRPARGLGQGADPSKTVLTIMESAPGWHCPQGVAHVWLLAIFKHKAKY